MWFRESLLGPFSSTEKYSADPRESSIWFRLGRGYKPPIVFFFNLRKSRNILHFIFPWESGIFRNYPDWSVVRWLRGFY